MTNKIEFFYHCCGLYYFTFFILSCLGLGILGIRVLFGSRSKKDAVIFTAASIVPLLVGMIATAEGYRSVRQDNRISMQEKKEGFQVARVTTYIGGCISVPFITLGMIALYKSRLTCKQPPNRPSEGRE